MYSVCSNVICGYSCVFVCTASAVLLRVAIAVFVYTACAVMLCVAIAVFVSTTSAVMLCVAIAVFLCVQRVQYCYVSL